jgi:glucuronokinase
MMRIAAEAYARAGLLGNPSDGYFGKTIAAVIKNFSAQVWMSESRDLRICASEDELEIYQNGKELIDKTNLYGYHSGRPLIKAAIKVFFDYCRSQNIPVEDKNFVIWYESAIPRQVGLGGSSAIIVAALRGLMKFYAVDIPIELQPTLALRAEVDELGINAGFMDRVVQVYEGCVYMDLDRSLIEKRGYGLYERLDSRILPQLYLAYRPDLSKVSGRALNDIRLAYERKDASTLTALNRLAEIAAEGREAHLRQDFARWPALMNENFDLRSRIMRISKSNLEMIMTARRCGASAKFAGSGGSIIGIYDGEDMYERLARELDRLGATVLKPTIE